MQNRVNKTHLFPDGAESFSSTVLWQLLPQLPSVPTVMHQTAHSTGLPGRCALLSSAYDESTGPPGQGASPLHQQQDVRAAVTSALWPLNSMSTYLCFKNFYCTVENLFWGNGLLLWVRWGKVVLGSWKEVSSLSLNKWQISQECAHPPCVHYLPLGDKNHPKRNGKTMMGLVSLVRNSGVVQLGISGLWHFIKLQSDSPC